MLSLRTMTAQHGLDGDSTQVVVDVTEDVSLTDAAAKTGDDLNYNEISTSTLADGSVAARMNPKGYDVESNVIQNEATSHRHPYRADIDGIRCIAVAAVVFFHAYRHLFPGGFIGVDIFFVISGYLITAIIFRQHYRRTFTYADFYNRRIRRIFPSLLLVITLTLIMGCLWLQVNNLQAMSSTLVAGTIFGANIQIMTLKSDYFGPDVNTNPFLHLWSLGVEEQFYILWPFLAGIVIRAPRLVAVIILLVFIVGSFGLNVGLVSVNPKLSFYFPFSRFWQMAAGSILAYVSIQASPGSCQNQRSTVAKYCQIAISAVGICLIVLGFILVNEDSVFPGWWSLLPTVGTALLIYAGPETPFNRYILGNRLFVFIGKISYPLYLWHWPLLVYAKELFPDVDRQPFWAQPYMMVIFAFILSVGTYYFIENKIRYSKSRYVSPLLLVIMVLFLIMGIIVSLNADSFSQQHASLPSLDPVTPPVPLPPIAEPLNSSRGPRKEPVTLDKVRRAVGEQLYPPPHSSPIPQDSPFASQFEGFILNPGQKKTIFVLGDSHAKMVSHRFIKLFEDAGNRNDTFPTVVYKAKNGVPPMPCDPDFALNIELIKKTKPDVVVIITNWLRYLHPGGALSDPLHSNLQCCVHYRELDKCSYQSPKDADEILRLFFDTMRELSSNGFRVYISTVPVQGSEYNPRLMYDANGLIPAHHQPISLNGFRVQNMDLFQKVENGINNSNTTVIDFSKNMCWNDVCEVVDDYGNPLMRDGDHFRPFFARDYVDVIDKIVSAVNN